MTNSALLVLSRSRTFGISSNQSSALSRLIGAILLISDQLDIDFVDVETRIPQCSAEKYYTFNF